MSSTNPTRLLPIPDPDRQSVAYRGTTIGVVTQNPDTDEWLYEDWDGENSLTAFTTAEEAANVLTQVFIEHEITVLQDIITTMKTINTTIDGQPSPFLQDITDNISRLLSSLNAKVSLLTGDLEAS